LPCHGIGLYDVRPGGVSTLRADSGLDYLAGFQADRTIDRKTAKGARTETSGSRFRGWIDGGFAAGSDIVNGSTVRKATRAAGTSKAGGTRRVNSAKQFRGPEEYLTGRFGAGRSNTFRAGRPYFK